MVCHRNGKGMQPREIQKLLKRHLVAADLPLDLTPHKLRHSFRDSYVGPWCGFAVRSGASRAFELVHDAGLHVHVSIARLKEAHRQAHPRA